MALQTWALKNAWIIKMGRGSTIRVCYPQTDLQKEQISVEAGGGGEESYGSSDSVIPSF